MFKKLIALIFIGLPLMSPVFAEEMLAKVDFTDAGITDVVQILAEKAGLDIVMASDNASQKRVTLHLKDISALDAIDYVLRTNGFNYERKDRSILVSTLPQDIAQSGYKKISRPVELSYLSSDKVAELIGKISPELSIVPCERANNLVIRGKESDVAEAFELIEKIDKPVPQILIEGQVVEISKSDSIRLGLDYNNGVFKFTNSKSEDIRTTLTALLGNGKANLLASPRIATLDNHEAVINIGDRIPYAVPVSSSGTTTQWTVDYIDAGVRLKITPKVGKDNQIITTLAPEVSSITEWRTTPAGDFPVISTRNAASTLRVKDGETIVVGGLDMETERENISRIPLVGQFPGLNLLFQNRTVEKTKTEIVFLITPHII